MAHYAEKHECVCKHLKHFYPYLGFCDVFINVPIHIPNGRKKMSLSKTMRDLVK